MFSINQTWVLISEESVSINFFDIGAIVDWMKSFSIVVETSSDNHFKNQLTSCK